MLIALTINSIGPQLLQEGEFQRPTSGVTTRFFHTNRLTDASLMGFKYFNF